MKQFLLGVLISSAVWTGILYMQSRGMVDVFSAEEAQMERDTEMPSIAMDTDTGEAAPKKRVKGNKRRLKNRTAPAEADLGYESGNGQVGDDLSAGARNVSMGTVGEEQLSNAEIEAAIDRRFSGIERCLTLMPPD
ncbi:MAG: hypothetical protein JXX14_11075, partial [Deltaproteobacteria bacterium]|nr:hypothetical protein [Deltaproteobacteria bacterium]